jgi:hypothetical protein
LGSGVWVQVPKQPERSAGGCKADLRVLLRHGKVRLVYFAQVRHVRWLGEAIWHFRSVPGVQGHGEEPVQLLWRIGPVSVLLRNWNALTMSGGREPPLLMPGKA